MGLGSHLWHINATWLLTSVHLFAILLGYFCHLAFDFWASLFHLFYFECDFQPVRFYFCLIGLVLFLWFEHVDLFEHADICYKLLKLKREVLPLRFHTPPVNPSGKISNDWSTYIYDPITKKNGLKILDAYCHRMWKWTEVPLYPGLFSNNQQSGADQTKTLTVPEGQ